jgi:hypothetical protein
MSNPIHIAVLLDSASVPPAVAELVAWIGAQPQLSCSAIVVLGAPELRPALGPRQLAGGLKPLRGLLWSLMMVIERARVRRSSLKSLFDAPVSLDAQPPAGGVYKFKAQANETLSGLAQRVREALAPQQPDFIVSCIGGTRSLVFASCAKQGLLELVHGSSQSSGDGSSGFWEVLNQNDKTAFAIRHVLPCGLQVKTLMHGYLPTQTSFLMNQATLVVQLHETLRRLLGRLAAGGDVRQMSLETVVEPVRRDKPSATQLISYGATVARRAITLRMRSLVGLQERWQVHYKQQDWTRLNLADANAIPNPPGGYFADPFLHAAAEGVFCFVEEFRESSQRGVISVLRLDANGPVYLGRVLDEAFHLSFPYIFEYAGELYMCPETHEARQIRLYKCKSFPLQWEMHSVAIPDLAAVDSMIFPAHGKWWMLAGVLPQGDVRRFPEMHLFSAPDPVSGQWQAHPQNPLKIDPEFARNGGLLRKGEKTYRVSQALAFSAYGASANISEIHTLTDSSYNELLIARVNAGIKPGVTGLHHIDSIDGLTVWDEKRLHSIHEGRRSLNRWCQWGLRRAVPHKEVKVS